MGGIANLLADPGASLSDFLSHHQVSALSVRLGGLGWSTEILPNFQHYPSMSFFWFLKPLLIFFPQFFFFFFDNRGCPDQLTRTSINPTGP